MTLHVEIAPSASRQAASGLGAILVVASCQRTARSIQELIQSATGQGVIALCGYEAALEAIEDHPGYFSGIVVDDCLMQDPDFPDFQSRLAEEEPELSPRSLMRTVTLSD